jgi:putative ABC transport system permease protein
MFRNYLATALRNLARNRLYNAITIAGLAIGFAAALLIGLYVRDEYSYDRFIPGHERVYRVSETSGEPGERPEESDITPAMVARALKLDFPQVEAVARLDANGSPPTVRRGDFAASELHLVWADPDFFRIIPLPVIAGDLAHSLDAPDSVVVTRAIARKYFGRDAPVGESLLIDGHPMRVTAVLEDLPSNTHLAADIFAAGRSPYGDIAHQEKVDTPLNETVATYFRLRPGATAESMEPGLRDFVGRHFPLNHLGGDMRNLKIVVHLVPLADIHLRPSTKGAFKPAGDRTVIAAIAGVGALIVLVAAINFVTLMTAAATRRAVEVGVRKTAGAARGDLIVQFMGESLLYVLLAGVLAMALAETVLPLFNAMLQRQIAFDYLHDPGLAAAVALAVLAVALLAGAYPALVLSAFRPAAVLKGGVVSTGGGGVVRQALVVVQFAVLVGLILFAVTITRQTVFALGQGMGVDKDNVLLIEAKPCTDAMRDEIRATPGVDKAACGSAMVLGLGEISEEPSVAGRRTVVVLAPVDFGFFDVYGLRPVAGRLFDQNRPADAFIDGAETNPPLVINQTAVRKLGFASAAAAIGQTVNWRFHTDLQAAYGADPAKPSQIIGVVPDFTFGSMRSPIPATLYMVGPKVSYYAAALNVKLDPRRIPQTLKAIDQVWKRVGDGQPTQRYFVTYFTLRLYLDTIKQGETIVLAALVALSIAALGLFALSAYTTERRTKEIGIRKAMGASAGDILRLLLWQFTQPVLWANLIAWPVSFLALNWWLGGFAYHVGVAPWTFLAAGGGSLLIAWATVFVHALRVSRAKPVGALRYE